jgi:hypothetical protein
MACLKSSEEQGFPGNFEVAPKTLPIQVTSTWVSAPRFVPYESRPRHGSSQNLRCRKAATALRSYLFTFGEKPRKPMKVRFPLLPGSFGFGPNTFPLDGKRISGNPFWRACQEVFPFG